MGKLKNLIIDLESSDTDFVMEHYGLFLEKAVSDKNMPHSWSDAINAIHWAAYLAGKNLIKLTISNQSREINNELSFPFKIPNNYKKIKL